MILLEELNWEKVKEDVGFWSFLGFTTDKFIDILGDAYKRLHEKYLVVRKEREKLAIRLGLASDDIRGLRRELNTSTVLLRKFVRESAAFCYREGVTDDEVDDFIFNKKRKLNGN